MSATQYTTQYLTTPAGQADRILGLNTSLGKVRRIPWPLRDAVLASVPPRFRQCLMHKLYV